MKIESKKALAQFFGFWIIVLMIGYVVLWVGFYTIAGIALVSLYWGMVIVTAGVLVAMAVEIAKKFRSR